MVQIRKSQLQLSSEMTIRVVSSEGLLILAVCLITEIAVLTHSVCKSGKKIAKMLLKTIDLYNYSGERR